MGFVGGDGLTTWASGGPLGAYGLARRIVDLGKRDPRRSLKAFFGSRTDFKKAAKAPPLLLGRGRRSAGELWVPSAPVPEPFRSPSALSD